MNKVYGVELATQCYLLFSDFLFEALFWFCFNNRLSFFFVPFLIIQLVFILPAILKCKQNVLVCDRQLI